MWRARSPDDGQGPYGPKEVTKSVGNGDVFEDVSIDAVSDAKILHIGKKRPVLEEGGELVG